MYLFLFFSFEEKGQKTDLLPALCMNELLAHWLLTSKSTDLSLCFLEPGAQVLMSVL